MSTVVREVGVDSLSGQSMSAPDAPAVQLGAAAPVPERPKAYDPNNLCWLDLEERKYDDTSDGIDWDDIIATTQDDFLAGRFAFNSADYPTHEEAMVALEVWLEEILQEVLRDLQKTASVTPSDASSP